MEPQIAPAVVVDRVIDVFPANQQEKVRTTLSESLKAVVAQTLFKRVDVRGRIAALEILICTYAVGNLIREGKTYQLPSVMQTGKQYGMQLLDDAIMNLLQKRMVSAQEAYTKCIDKKKFVPFLKRPPDILI